MINSIKQTLEGGFMAHYEVEFKVSGTWVEQVYTDDPWTTTTATIEDAVRDNLNTHSITLTPDDIEIIKVKTVAPTAYSFSKGDGDE